MERLLLFRRFLSGALALTLALCLLSGAVSAAGSRNRVRTVRVAVYNDSLYAYRDENGVWRGTDVECMTNIAHRAGFQVEFVDSNNDTDFLGSLDRGTYDIVADVIKTPARAEKYLFSDAAIGSFYNTLAVRADDRRWSYGDITQVSDMTIGVIASYASSAAFRAWCADHSVTPVIVEYSTIDELTSALLAGKIDGEVYGATYGKKYTGKLRSVMKFLPESYYFLFRRDDAALKNAVDTALMEIVAENPDYLTDLLKKYGYQFGTGVVPFSADENEFIRRSSAITVAVLADDEPFYKKADDGTDSGILPDYYKLLASYSGLRFQFASFASQEDAITAVSTGRADVLGIFSGGLIAADRCGLTLTSVYSNESSVLIARSGKSVADIHTLAVKARSADALTPALPDTLTGTSQIMCETAEDCLRAVNRGQADAALVGMPSSTWLLNQTNSSAYSVTPLPGASLELCGAIAASNRALGTVLNKSISATNASFGGIVMNNTLPADNWQTAVSRIPPLTALVIAAIMLALILGLVRALILLRRRQRERAAVMAAQAKTEREKIQLSAIEKNAEERARFFSNISHDMRTPLNAVLGFTREARRPDITDAQRNDYLAKVDSSGRLLLDLINDTLTVSKLSSGKLELHPVPCRTSELFEAVAAPVRNDAEMRGVRFLVDASAMPDKTILIDRLNMEKIFLNLLTNAVKYTPPGGSVWFTVSQEPQTESTLRYVVSVRDSGIGISPAFLPHIFEPFSQEKRPGYESVGTGLGLSIVKQLVEMMGGTIEVESELDRGSVFTVRLQFAEAEASLPKPAESAADFSFTGKKILVCEDNALNREIALALLAERGLAADTAPDGSEGLRLFSESAAGEYAAVLMDVRMPVMDGLAATRAIRALERPDAADVPIIAMTADAFADDVQKCLAAGMNAHVAKPIEPETLFRTLQKLLADK